LAEHPALDLQFLSTPGPDPLLREHLYALLDDFEPTAIHEDESADVWRVFFGSPVRRDAAAAHLSTAVAPHLLRTSALDVPDEDWARRSQQDLKAVTVEALTIAPPWDVPSGGSVILIEPSTGFGTGHHATTRLCLRLMQELDLRSLRVVDVGTGSGVLALAAWTLGAGEVVGVDNDPDALENARANIARNGAAARIDLLDADLRTLTIPAADLVVANLTAAILVREAAALQSLVRRGGHLILSGFTPDQAVSEVGPAFLSVTVVGRAAEDDWGALWLSR
jgi:ribosomal protein L11 methyltransferase